MPVYSPVPPAYRLGETLMRIENVSVEKNGRPILKNVNAEVKDIIVPGESHGQVVGFLGPSGVGKTTLFRIIAGLDKPTSGRVVLFNGTKGDADPETVGVVAQNYPLFEHRSVLSNLMLAATRKEPDRKKAREKVANFVTKFGLEECQKSYPTQLSGGQRQRVAILQQVLCSGHFLLMDEPFSGLDEIMKERVCHLIHDIASMHDHNTIIVITHDVTAAASVADHIWLMGRDAGPNGSKLPGARIVETYNLMDRGLRWSPSIVTTPALSDFVREVKGRFYTL